MVRKEALRRGYSPRTINTYKHCLDKFFRQCHKDPRQVKKQDVLNYLDNMVQLGRAGSTLNVHLSALQFLYSQVLHKKLLVNIKYSKRRKRMPGYLSREEIDKLLSEITNKKHWLMTALCYASGVRVSELLNLRVRDLDVSNGQGWVRGGKGNKDRPFIIADGLKEVMAEAIDGMEQDDFLFSGKKGKMHPASFRAVLITAAKEAGLKHVHPHMLRHSFASHLAEQKYAATDIQVLLGHRNVETTMVYTHMVAMKLLRVRSPFDGK